MVGGVVVVVVPVPVVVPPVVLPTVVVPPAVAPGIPPVVSPAIALGIPGIPAVGVSPVGSPVVSPVVPPGVVPPVSPEPPVVSLVSPIVAPVSAGATPPGTLLADTPPPCAKPMDCIPVPAASLASRDPENWLLSKRKCQSRVSRCMDKQSEVMLPSGTSISHVLDDVWTTVTIIGLNSQWY